MRELRDHNTATHIMHISCLITGGARNWFGDSRAIFIWVSKQLAFSIALITQVIGLKELRHDYHFFDGLSLD